MRRDRSDAGVLPGGQSPSLSGMTPAPDQAPGSSVPGRTPDSVVPERRNAFFSGLEPDEIVFERYQTIRKLGRGGMGEVWLVLNLELGAQRALKIIYPDRLPDPAERARFRREARAMALLAHPHAVVVHHCDSVCGYIEMEYIEGRSLDRVLRKGVPQPLDWVARVLAQLGEVLQEAHAHRLVHRDLKPSNLMLVAGRPEGKEHLKVLDFGIAKILGEPPVHELHTLTGAFIGTPPYASPEQAKGQADARSDVYAVGVLLFEFLTGFRPFTGPAAQQLVDTQISPPPRFAAVNPAVAVPSALEDLVLRCLAKDPAERPQTIRELTGAFLGAARPAPPHEATDTGPNGPLMPAVPAPESAPPPPPWPIQPRLSPDALTLRRGETRTVTLAVDRRGNSGPVAVRWEALPPGIAVPDLTIPDGADRAEVRLGVTAAAGLGDHELRLVATPATLAGRGWATLRLAVAESAEALFQGGLNYREDKQPEKAIAEFGKALALDPGHAGCHYYLGKIHHDRRDYDAAIAHYGRAFACGLDDPYAYIDRGNAWYDKAEYGAAIADYSRAIETDPGCVLAYQRRARAHAKLGHEALHQDDLLSAAQAKDARAMRPSPRRF
jgi:serine/threonine protein kinase